jgi:tetratricopeptide (TPR) repeat protein
MILLYNRHTMSDESDPVELSKAGFHALEEQNLDLAESIFHGILEIEPENCYAFVGLAECAKKHGNLSAAAGWYQRCLAQDPDNEVSIRGLIMCYANQGLHEKVVGLWESHANALQDSDSIALKSADSFRKLHNTDMAAMLYQTLLDTDPLNKYAMSGMAHLLYEEEQYTEAIKIWQRFLDTEPESIIAHTCIGNCCRKLRNFENEMEYYRRAARIEPDNFYALFGIADCARGLKMYEQSLQYWRRILDTDPKNRMILTRAGEACFRLNLLDDARGYFDKALSLGDDLYALMGMARLLKAQHDGAGAAAFYRRAADISGARARFAREIDSFLQNH